IPWCDQTGVPIHFHSSVISGSASRINARMRARVSPRHPPRSRIRWSMSWEASFPVACSRLLIPARTGSSPSAFAICGLPPARSFNGLASLAPSLALVPAFGGDLDLVADLRGLLARDVPLALGFALLSVIIRPFLLDVSQVALELVISNPLTRAVDLVFAPEKLLWHSIGLAGARGLVAHWQATASDDCGWDREEVRKLEPNWIGQERDVEYQGRQQ